MAGFYIEKLVVSGKGKEPSTVEFSDGLNFIVGPSNTGKTMIFECLDYIFGFEPQKNKPFQFDPELGYNHFKLITRTPNGTVVFERYLGENKITLSGTDPNFEYRVYSLGHKAKYNISNVWLQMIGINESHKILASKSGRINELTWRGMLHMFFIKQQHVTRTSSVLLNPSLLPNMAETSAKAIVLFLMTGMDADSSIVFKDKRIITAKRGAVIDYIKSTVARLANRESELLKKYHSVEMMGLLSNYSINDAKSEIDTINTKIDELQYKINKNIDQSKALMNSIYTNNSRLSECDTLVDRFSALRSQYLSDIERLSFVVDGKIAHSSISKPDHCPFCDSEIQSSEDPSYADAAKAELQHIRSHLVELEKAEKDLDRKRYTIVSTIEELENRKSSIDRDLSLELKPQFEELKNRLNMYRYVVEINKELDVVRKEELVFNQELFEKETETEPTQIKYDMNEYFDYESLHTFEETLRSILEAIHYEGSGSARINMNTFDLEVGGREKAVSNGGGYCGLLNSVVSLALVEYLEKYGEYSPGIFAADSPLTQLSESEFTSSSNTMKVGFVNHLLSISNENESPFFQIIIAEHKEKLPIDDISQANIIEFTGVKNHGRYGFLNGVFNYE
jgi:predicted  nucleic acid-binding Zn-ribbon protein